MNNRTEMQTLAAELLAHGSEATTEYIQRHGMPEGLLAALAEAKNELSDEEHAALQRFRNGGGQVYPGAEEHAVRQQNDEERDVRRAAAARFPFRTLAEIAAEVDAAGQPTWLFEGVIVAGDYGVLSAEKKAGKTWAMADAAVSCAAGLPWLGRFPCGTQGPVMNFYNEGSRRKWVRRTRAVGASKGLTQAQTDALPIRAEFIAPQLKNAADLEAIAERVEEVRPALVILDPLYRSASGAKGGDLYGMGDLLGRLQECVQDSGATLLLSHHWNKSGTGEGHDRSSGAGPAEWGRFLISVAVKSRRTDKITGQTTARLRWSFTGDEIPDTELSTVRRVHAENPDDLSSPMNYAIAVVDDDIDDQEDPHGLSPAQRKVLGVLRPDQALTTKEIGDLIAQRHGTGLKRNTISDALTRVSELGLAEEAGVSGPHGRKFWLAIPEFSGQ